MSEQQSSYRQIFKATSIFGGVQVFQILISIVRSKLVAVLLGAQGMGISGLFLSVTTVISGITGLGINVSAVRNISEANSTGDEMRIATVVSVVKKLALLTGLLGTLLTIVLSPWLSQVTFGSDQYTWSFIALSVTFLLGSVASGQSVLLQGMRKLSYLAKANILGASVGLLVSIPLYYVYGIAGIVPAIILSAIATTFFAYFFGKRVVIQRTAPVSFSEAWHAGKGMISMGIMLTLSTLIAAVAAYVVRLFINQEGTLVDVGLYSAGFAIVNTYVGMIFTAMGTDYYPRLSGIVHDQPQVNKLINQQAEMALLILGPILILFLILLKYAVTILYTTEFLRSTSMIEWAIISIFFKAMVWSVGFLILAKGDSKFFLVNELIVNIYTLALNLVAYYYFGLEGLGVSLLIAYVLATVQTLILIQFRYSFSFNRRIYFLVLGNFLLALACLFINRTQNNEGYRLIFSFLIWVIVISYSMYKLNRILGVKDFLIGLIRKVN